MSKELEFDKIVRETDRKWNCMKATPTVFNEKSLKETTTCFKK